MRRIEIPFGSISVAETRFKCPHCEKKYDDINDKYLNRCNKNKNSWTTIKCECNNKFGVTHDITGDIVSFKLKK